MFVAAALLMLSLSAAPRSAVPPLSSDSARVCVAPEQTGTFRLVATKSDGKTGALALLLLENIDGCLEATFVTDEKGPAAIDSLSMTNGTLTGRLNVTGEFAKLTAKFEGKSVEGSIVAKKGQWKLEGKKTS